MGGISARSGFAVGMNIPSVRFDALRYLAATRCTSAGVTLRKRSRCRKNKRQSPIAIHSLKDKPTRSELLSVRSMFFKMLVRARSTSSLVGGAAMMPSIVCKSASRAASSEASWRTSAPKRATPGSRSWKLKPKVALAFFVSTSALYKRPDGVSPKSCVNTSMAAKSGSEPAGM